MANLGCLSNGRAPPLALVWMKPKPWQALLERHLQPLLPIFHPLPDAARARLDKGEYWWELRPCDYYQAPFDAPKIFWP